MHSSNGGAEKKPQKQLDEQDIIQKSFYVANLSIPMTAHIWES